MGLDLSNIWFVVLFVAIVISILCCARYFKHCYDRNVRELNRRPERTSVFIIPMPSIEENDLYSPPHYNRIDIMELPPPYSEVEMKPDLFPLPEELPPPYIQFSASDFAPSLLPVSPQLPTLQVQSSGIPSPQDQTPPTENGEGFQFGDTGVSRHF
nr:transmembrane protein 92 [Paramormyrops kingsleyae]